MKKLTDYVLWIAALALLLGVASALFRAPFQIGLISSESTSWLVWLLALLLSHLLPSALLLGWVYARRISNPMTTSMYVIVSVAIWIAVDWSGVIWPFSLGYTRIEFVPYIYWFGEISLLLVVGVASTLFQKKAP